MLIVRQQWHITYHHNQNLEYICGSKVLFNSDYLPPL